jgi:hypothetical protein
VCRSITVVLAIPPYGIGLATSDGHVMDVVWPFGYSGAFDGDDLVLLGPAGHTVAREGDLITMGGGFSTEAWYACPSGVGRAISTCTLPIECL